MNKKRPALSRRLRAGVALRALVAATGPFAVLTVASIPAFADGGTAGNGGGGASGGIGGSGSSGIGGNGTAGAGVNGGGGGGGGNTDGAGGNGGAGGGGVGGAGGAAGAVGSVGSVGAVNLGGGGGGGGGGGASGSNAASLPGGALTGGTGGVGGAAGASSGVGNGGGGGGGGSGGYGAAVTGATANTNAAAILGGLGGVGGVGGATGSGIGGNGGNGGDGGIGIFFSMPNASLNNTSGSIQGGNGASGGALGSAGGGNGNAGLVGMGGAGIVGGGLAIINNGTIAGGLAGDAVTQANAITFTGGINSLTIQSGSTISGNVVAVSGGSDTFALAGSTNSSFDTVQIGTQYQNFTAFNKTGTSVWTLTGTPGQATPWVISDGTLKAGAATNVFGATSAITVNTPGFLDLAGNNQQIGSLAGSGTVTNSGGAGATLTMGDVTNTSFSGVIEDGASQTALTKQGTGIFTLTGTNTYTGGTTINGGTLQLGNGGTTGSIVGNVTDNGTLAFNRSDSVTFGGLISGTGSVSQIGIGTTILTADSTYTGGTTISAGTLQIGNGGTTGSIVGNVTDNGTLAFNRSDSVTFGGVISGTGSVSQIGPGTTILTANSTYTGGTTIAAGTLQLGIGGTSGSVVGNVANSGVLAFNRSDASIFGGTISGTGSVSQIGTGTTILTADSTYAGGTTITAGTLQLGNGGTSGSIAGNVINNGVFAVNRSDSFVLTNVISGTGSFQQNGTGTTVLSGNNPYSGPTTVTIGTLIVDGSIASSSLTTVSSGARLAGSGTVGSTVISTGGTFAPGPGGTPGTMTVAGNLAFQSGALYVVQVNPLTASTTNASGNATLAGTVQARFLPGSFVQRDYTILSAAGGRIGTFDALTTLGLPANFQTSLSYTGNTAVLNLTAQLVPPPIPPTPPTPPGPPTPAVPPPPVFTVNQLNVGNAIDNFFNNGGALPPTFVSLFGLTGSHLTNALSRLSGEAATGAQKVAFQLTDQFLNLMLDPFVDGRSGVGESDHPALGFAPEREITPPEIALAYASVFKAPPKAVPVYAPRWTVWGGAYGGSNRTSGDIAVIGSHDLSARTVGFAGGLDYRLTPDTVVGLAFAGGGTDWSLSQGLGGGKSDAFQAGIYGATKSGPAYLAAAFAFANHWMSTDRIAFAGDHLTADFNAQSYGGRLEGGYRFGTPYGGMTPYAAIQAQSFHTPRYAETDAIANAFGLAFGSRDATDTRSELGARFDRVVALYPNYAVLTLRGRVAWAHDGVSDPTLAAVFQTLPGASFTVNGAVPAQNSALTSAGAELRLGNGITLLGKFDGQFSGHSSTYAGTGTVRYAW